MLKVHVIFGIRLETINMAPPIKRIDRQPERFQALVCVADQHRKMPDQVLTFWNQTGLEFDHNIV